MNSLLNFVLNAVGPTLSLAIGCVAVTAHGATSGVELRGIDFQGGAQSHFGAVQYGRPQVNYVYAQSTGAAASMTARFTLATVPTEPQVLLLEAMDDDAATRCRIRISLNGHDLVRGPSGFSDARWQRRTWPIPTGTLRSGTNVVSILNEEPQGNLGAPPWFMVARAAVAEAGYKLSPIEQPRLKVSLPSQARPLPEPLSPGQSEPGFKFRGTKGWVWTVEQYLEEIPLLPQLKLNFLMNCYGSMFSSLPGEPWRNEWWQPMTDAKRAGYAKIIRACRERGISFCFAFHPQLAATRPLNPTSAEDLEAFYQHYAWAQSQGVQWFSVSLDDVSWGTEGPAVGGSQHAQLVNAVFGRLRRQDPGAQLIFCPVPYWGDGTNPEHRAYLEALAREMHPEVYVFWTGDGVVTPRITRQAAESYKRIVNHRLFLWDNYPVNDGSPTLHLGPVSGRDPDLPAVIDGYMSNPLASQNQINRLPLATCADYAYNPTGYDPARSIGQAIFWLAPTDAQRQALKELVEFYPGFIFTGGGTGSNPVRSEFGGLLADPDAAEAAPDFQLRLEGVFKRFAAQFPERFAPARKTIANDLEWMKQQVAQPAPKAAE